MAATVETAAPSTGAQQKPVDRPPADTAAARLRRRVWLIVVGYAVVGCLWILFSDRALAVLVPDPGLLVRFGTIKGIGYVLVTALLLLMVMRKAFARLAQAYVDLEASDREVQRVNRLYAALSAINRAVVRATDRAQLFDEACRALVADGGFSMAWIGWHDTTTNRLTPMATSGGVGRYLDRVTVHIDDVPEGRDPSGIALHEGRTYVANDMRDDPALAPWQDAIRDHGLRASASLPLRLRGEVVAVLNVYAHEADYFKPEEVALLEEAAADLSYAMENLRNDADRRRAEEDLRQLNATLESKVRSRTDELRAALVRAETADETKSRFLATMSHELRTPLNSIIGFTGIVLQGMAGPLTDEQTKQLGMVRTSARHLLALINDILDISRIEAGELEFDREPFDLDTSIAQVVETIRPSAAAKQLQVEVDLGAGLGMANGDRRRFEQVMLNLLSNAVKFTEQGQVRVVGRREEPSKSTAGRVRIEVHDTGIGIGPADLASLFQPFRQIDAGMSRNHDGTGLGLAICRRLLRQMGGTVHAESSPGTGSTFTVTLPLDGQDAS